MLTPTFSKSPSRRWTKARFSVHGVGNAVLSLSSHRPNGRGATGNLVIREFDHNVWSNLPRLPESMPCGAGLCVRRNVALHYLDLHESGKRSFQFDRNGTSLLSGGDNDLAACACDIGLGVGLIASLKLTTSFRRSG